MVYIPFPRQDLNTHQDLTTWRNNTHKKKGDWTLLKVFLAEQARLIDGIHPIPKCWYSELPQGDNLAVDVEHFRPKNQASPFTAKQLKTLEKQTGFKLKQATTEGAYHWLEFDYRNYRLVTAITNRGGAKHIYFPIIANSNRLNINEFAWAVQEYPYFLDPADKHDAALLLVLPNGKIIPSAPKTEPTDADFNNLPASWHSDGFNYIRALVTIKLYRLDEKVFELGRKQVYDSINNMMNTLSLCFPLDANPRFEQIKDNLIKDLTIAALPSAPFSLAARSALAAYLPPMHFDENLRQAIAPIPRQILDKIDTQIAALTCSWIN